MSNDEKTTELELPVKRGNIVHVNFFGPRRSHSRAESQRAVNTAPAEVRRLGKARRTSSRRTVSPWLVRVAALAAILALSFLIL